MRGNQHFEELVRYLDTELSSVLSNSQREHVYALCVRSLVNARVSERRKQTEVELEPTSKEVEGCSSGSLYFLYGIAIFAGIMFSLFLNIIF